MTRSDPEPGSHAPADQGHDQGNIVRPWRADGEPVMVAVARDCVVTDVHGTDYLDFTAGLFVNQAGHCHPRVVAAAAEQLTKVTQVSGRHLTPALSDLAGRLLRHSPGSVGRVLFTTGGSESNEFALRIARQHTGRADIAYLDNAYHGLTLGALAMCGATSYRATAGVPLDRHSYPLPSPYCYRCPFQRDCRTQCVDEWERRLDARRSTTGAVIAEPAQSAGGIIPPPRWWERVERIRRERGLLLILDEVQTGLGRTGKMFGAEHYGLQPDLVSVGKGVSGGVGALGAVLCRAEVVSGFRGGTSPTAAGNAVSAAAGAALIDVVVERKLPENAAAMGAYLHSAIAELDDPWVGDIRFLGLFGGVELVCDRATREALPAELVAAVNDAMRADRILLTISGPHGNVLRLQPPLTITRQHVDTCVAVLAHALAKTRARRGLGHFRVRTDG